MDQTLHRPGHRQSISPCHLNPLAPGFSLPISVTYHFSRNHHLSPFEVSSYQPCRSGARCRTAGATSTDDRRQLTSVSSENDERKAVKKNEACEQKRTEHNAQDKHQPDRKRQPRKKPPKASIIFTVPGLHEAANGRGSTSGHVPYRQLATPYNNMDALHTMSAVFAIRMEVCVAKCPPSSFVSFFTSFCFVLFSQPLTLPFSPTALAQG